MVSGVSVHGWLTSLPLDLGEAAHHGKECVIEEDVHFTTTRKQKKQEEAGMS
jgi:hypothetical protein